jgi:5-oxoprolinase (ATP-hydrolysing)
MPPFSTRIEEEGVQINNVLLVDRRVLREAVGLCWKAANTVS